MKHNTLLILAALALGLGGCYYDVEEELYPNQAPCVTTDMSYLNDVVPILDAQCNSCHSTANAFGGVILDNYARVKQHVDNSTLLGVIRHEAGFSPMPKGAPKLLDCDIAKIEAWVNAGALDN